MPKWVRKWKVPSSSSDREYTVSQAEDGSWGCSCPRWKFHRERCKHIDAVAANPDAYAGDAAKALPEIIPGNVEACEIIAGRCLHPLIPLDGRGTDVLATIVYDLLAIGYTFGFIRKRFRMIPREWTALAVRRHVERHGRMLCKPVKLHDHWGTEYVQVPA